MARETLYLVQAFKAGKGQGLVAEPAIRCRSSDAAVRAAERLTPTKVGVVAFSTSADVELGDYDETPSIIFRSGRLPERFEDG